MNKRWWITIAIIVGVLILIGVLYENGLLNTQWTGLSMIFAALAGPYTAIKSWLGKDRTSEAVMKKYEYLKKEETQHRETTDLEIQEREERIRELDQKISDTQKEVEEIQRRKEKVREEIDDMSIEELQDEAVNYFGD
jgi:peptidoglycan hydrolase CwlO-like protein